MIPQNEGNGEWNKKAEAPDKSPQTHWIKIEGEASLPTDDEALCLFAEWEGGIMKDRWIVKWKVAKTDISHHHFTHYTILTKPVK